MEIVNNILNVFTSGIVILNFLFIITLFAKTTVNLPPLLFGWDKLSPTRWYIFYPSFFYQLYIWIEIFK